jgi:hypothetical protein
MESIPGYGELNLIYESANSLIFRSRKLPENLPVVLKLLKAAGKAISYTPSDVSVAMTLVAQQAAFKALPSKNIFPCCE